MSPKQNTFHRSSAVKEKKKFDVELRVFESTDCFTVIPAHKVSISQSSKIFREIISQSKEPVTQVDITDFPIHIVQAYLSYLCSNSSINDYDVLTLLELINFGDLYKVRSLKDEVLKLLSNYNISTKNFLKITTALNDDCPIEACDA